MLAFFVSRAGLHIDLYERGEAIGTVSTVSAQVSNNSFETMRNVTVQFGTGPVQTLGDMGPFARVLVSPESGNLFDKVTVTANEGSVSVIKFR